MAERFYWLLAGLGARRLTHLLESEDGPWDCFAKLRNAPEAVSGRAISAAAILPGTEP